MYRAFTKLIFRPSYYSQRYYKFTSYYNVASYYDASYNVASYYHRDKILLEKIILEKITDKLDNFAYNIDKRLICLSNELNHTQNILTKIESNIITKEDLKKI